MNVRSTAGSAWLQVLLSMGLGALLLMQLARAGEDSAAGGRSGLFSITEARSLPLKPLLTMRLHGSTPCMAWSPDSQRLVINDAHDPWTELDSLPAAARKSHGLHVLDLVRRQKIHVSDRAAYHPFWLTGSTLAFARNSYSDDERGLFTAHAGPRARLQRVGPRRIIHNAYPAKNGKLLVFVDGPPGYGWYFMDPASGELTKAPVVDESGGARALSWARPENLIREQCARQVGEVQTFADANLGVALQIGSHVFSLADEQAWKFERAMGGNPMVQPCLSPDGRKLAYLADDGAGAMQLKIVAVPDQQQALAAASTPDASSTPSLEATARLLLHGSTPSLAWSPDGRRVAANAAYEYYGHDAELNRHRDKLGIWTVDAYTGQSAQVHLEQGFHPFWLSNQIVGWGHSRYEDGKPGLYLSEARPGAVARRIGKLEGIHRTAAARDGQILVYVGWPEYKRWGKVDPNTGDFSPLPGLEKMSSWDTPENLIDDQCMQTLGDVKLSRHGKFGLLLEVAGRRYRLAQEPLIFFKGDYGSGAAQAVSACLSPTGDRLAYLVQAERGAELRIAPIPR